MRIFGWILWMFGWIELSRAQNLRGNAYLNKFYGTWNVTMTNIKDFYQEQKCMQYYFSSDSNLQFTYSFKKVKKSEKGKLMIKSGLIHIDELEKVNTWRLNPDDDDENKGNFVQHILYINDEKNMMIISDDKKNKIYVLTRNQYLLNDIRINEIEDILQNLQIDNNHYFYIVDHSFC